MNTNPENFESWLNDQLTNEGLVDIKFAVARGKGVSVEAITSELLACESMIKSNFVRSAPKPTSEISSSVKKIIDVTTI